MKLLEAFSGTLSLHALLDLLSDAVLVLDRSGRLSFANAAALQLLHCEAGWPLERLQPVLGAPVLRWVRAELAATAPGSQGPQAALPDGRNASVALQRLDARRWALRLQCGSVATAQTMATKDAGLRSGNKANEGQPAFSEWLKVLWESPLPITLADAQCRLTDVNQAFLDFCGFNREQVLGIDPIELQPEADRAESRALRQRQSTNLGRRDTPTLLEHRLIDAGGRIRWARESRHAVADIQGRTVYMAVLQDTTAEHAARERADYSVRELKDWFNLSPMGMVLFEDTGLLVHANRAFETMVGPLPALLSDAEPGIQQLLAFSNGRSFAPVEPDAAPLERHAWLAPGGGAARRLRAAVRCYETPGGNRRYMAVVEDRSMEEERDLAQMQIGALMDTAGVGLATFQESSGWVHRHLAGAAPSSDGDAAPPAGLHNISRSIVLPESLPEFEKVQHALRHTLRVEARYAIQHATMGLRWLLTRVEPATLASGQRSTSVVTLDITDQHQSQQRSEQLLREMTTILESSNAGMAYVRGNQLVRCNFRFENMLGLSPGRATGSSIVELFALQPQAERIADETMQALAQDHVYETEFEIASLNGPRWYSLSARRSGLASDSIEAIIVLSDITRLKSQQSELEVLARDRELMFSLSEVGIAFLRHGRIQRANDALATLTGYTVSELQDLALDVLFVDRAEFDRLWAREDEAMRRSGRWSGERQLRRRDAQLLWVQVSKKLVVDGDPGGGIIASYVNVDARRHAEQAVALQAERTRAILDSVLVGIVTVGADGIEWMNRSACRMFAGNLEGFLNQPISTVATDEAAHPFRQTQYLNVLVEGQAETFECRVKARDGREFWVVGNAVVTGRGHAGRQLTYALLDIDRRREAEARIAEAQASLQRLIEMAPLAIALFDASSLRVLQLNQTAAEIFGFTAVALVGLSLEEITDPELAATMRVDMETALATGTVTKREYAISDRGESRLWDARYLPLGPPDEQTDQLLLVATDVTEQRAAQEARLEAAIEQRDMLVKEVHHRIKNNLQGVAGLLQQIAARKPEVGPAISEVVSQVQAIAQVYGLQVGASGPLRVRNVLEAITTSVQRTFGCVIALTLEGDDKGQWVLPEAESIPIALTVNELLTNAVKHSRGGQAGSGDAGTLSCGMVCTDTSVCIVIGNTGRLVDGFILSRIPGGVSGLGLVKALLPRRSASLDIEQHGSRVLATVTLTPPSVSRLGLT